MTLPTSSPRLRLSQLDDSTKVKTFNNSRSLSIDSLLVDISGIGSKMGKILENLGLCTVKELLLYYPRDYVDYSALKRIGSLEEGHTATVVATIRRSNAFTSPRNPNLSILDLKLSLNQLRNSNFNLYLFVVGRNISTHKNRQPLTL